MESNSKVPLTATCPDCMGPAVVKIPIQMGKGYDPRLTHYQCKNEACRLDFYVRR